MLCCFFSPSWTLLLSLYALICNFICGDRRMLSYSICASLRSMKHRAKPIDPYRQHSISRLDPFDAVRRIQSEPQVCVTSCSACSSRFVGNNFHFYTFPYCTLEFFLAVLFTKRKQLKTTTTARGRESAGDEERKFPTLLLWVLWLL